MHLTLNAQIVNRVAFARFARNYILSGDFSVFGGSTPNPARQRKSLDLRLKTYNTRATRGLPDRSDVAIVPDSLVSRHQRG